MLFIDNVQADTFRCMDCVTDPLEEIETLSDEIKDGNEIKLPELKRRLMEIAMLLSLPPHIFSQFHQLLEKGTYQYIPPDGVGQNYTAARFILPVREFATA